MSNILNATHRTLKGRKTRALRVEGQVPAIVYGSGIEPASITIDRNAFLKMYREAGESTIVELTIDQKEPVHSEIKNFRGFAKNLIFTLLDQQNQQHIHSDDWQRTIYIDASAAQTTEFNLTDEKKTALIEAGRKGVKEYFEWFDNNPTVNKPESV